MQFSSSDGLLFRKKTQRKQGPKKQNLRKNFTTLAQWSELLTALILSLLFNFFLAEYLIRSDNHQGHSQATFLDFPTFTDRFTSIQMPERWKIVKVCIN